MTVYTLFKEQVIKNPNSVAVSFDTTNLTYIELEKEVDRMTSSLLNQGVKKGDILGLCVNRSVEMIVALLSIIKSGATYLPLDPSFPDKRLEYMLNDSKAPYLISEASLVNKFRYYNGQILNIEKLKEQVGQLNQEDNSEENNLVYIIYTSGSTGNPKGVQITHKSLVNFLVSMQKTPGINHDDAVLSLTTLSFDIAGLEIFLPLVSGAKVVVASKEETKDGKLLLEKIENISIMQATPSTWKLLLESGWNKKLRLKALCGGEPVSRDLADKLLELVDELWNMYGPTETTIWSSCSRIERGNEIIHLGRPIANTQFYIVDKNNNFCPPDVAGELLIGGAGLSVGYLNREELTKEKFIPNPFDKENKTKVYRTGDLVKLNSKMQIEYLGRIDNQIKIRGFRIELGEIENAIRQTGIVNDVIVVVKNFGADDKRLAAFIISDLLKKEKNILNEIVIKIKNFISKVLPDYMVPLYFIPIESLPLLPNGKVNRKELEKFDTNTITNDIRDIKRPENKNEEILLNIWKKLLNVESISTDDNFFDIGGHSILAAQMFTELEKVTGKRIPLATLFKAQTIAELANVIEKESLELKWSPLVKIKKGKPDAPNLFLVHGAEGNVLLYRDLANYLSPDCTIYGLQSRGLNGSGYIPASIEEMAVDYIEAIKNVQPDGPYNIGGYCMGGTIAYEIAQELYKAGDEVKNLFLIETYNICFNENQFIVSSGSEKIENIKFHFNNVKRLSGSDKTKFLTQKAKVLKRRTIARLNFVSSKVGISITNNQGTSKATFKVRDINDKAQTEYKPEVYNGKTVLLKPMISYSSEPDPNFGWDKLIKGKYKVYNLDLAPRGMLIEPYVVETAAIISKEIQET